LAILLLWEIHAQVRSWASPGKTDTLQWGQ
jgi:hypothetical protein